MTDYQWNLLHTKLCHLRSCMIPNKDYKYATQCIINSDGVDGWIKNANAHQMPNGMSESWGEIMKDLNKVYKITKHDVMHSGYTYAPYIPKF